MNGTAAAAAAAAAAPASPAAVTRHPPAVPEDAALEDVSPFELAGHHADGSKDSSTDRLQQQHRQQQPKKKRGLLSCCFGGSDVKHEEQAGSPAAAAAAASLPMNGSLQKRLSHRDSTKRPIFRKMGSLAYSDADWFDACSCFEGLSGDHADLLAEVDQLSRQLSVPQTGPWVPDPPLKFAGDMPQRYLPYPLDVSRFCGYWARDYDRSTPPPQPIDLMLNVNFLTKRVHNSIPGALVSETDKEMTLLVKPTVVPPGLNKYSEVFDHINGSQTSWMLRRDLRSGGSQGRIFMSVDGTLVVRVEGKSLLSNSIDSLLEEYWRLEEGGNVLVARQCCEHVPTGKTAVQFLIGIKQANPPKGWV